MAMSGVKVNDECIKMWEKLKSQKIKACNFKLSSNLKEIIVEDGSVIEKGHATPWKQWTDSLPDKECRYGYAYASTNPIFFVENFFRRKLIFDQNNFRRKIRCKN